MAKLASKPPHGDEWAYEIKWDGYRLAVHITPMGIRIITRGGHDWTHRFPGIVASAKEFSGVTMILDGEAVVLDEQGRSDFGRLQNSLGGRGGKRYDADHLVDRIAEAGSQVVIPPKRNRKVLRHYDADLYKERNKIERFFNKLKQFRRVATRYDKLLANFMGVRQTRRYRNLAQIVKSSPRPSDRRRKTRFTA